jgi:hypothetical protein
MSFAPETESLAKPEVMLRVPMGLASPLWGLFAGAAMTGATWWWMTRWARPQNLEAMFAAPTPEAAVAPEAASFAEPVAEATEAAAEAAVEAMEAVEAVAGVAPDPVAEALIEGFEVPEPVGGESAPISPVLEALAPEPVEPVVVAGGAADVALEPVAAAQPKKRPAATKPD